MRTARPILFSTPMIRALLDGRKSMTRRIVKQQERLRMGTDVLIEGDHRPEYLNEYGSWQQWVPNAKTMRCPGGHMKMLLLATHALVFVLGIRFAEWSARENHASAFAAGRWLRSWFVK